MTALKKSSNFINIKFQKQKGKESFDFSKMKEMAGGGGGEGERGKEMTGGFAFQEF